MRRLLNGIRMAARLCVTRRRVDLAHPRTAGARGWSSDGHAPLSVVAADSPPDQWFAPHMVHFFDSMTAIHSVIGPFTNPLEAVSFADRIQREVEGSGGGCLPMTFSVVPLERPRDFDCS